MELFQALFPSSVEPAQRVLKRLEAVASVREDLTSKDRGRDEFDDLLSPWNSTAIEEGVLCKAEGYSGKGSRYADLLCRGESGTALMAVEYVGNGDTTAALGFWSKSTKVRCVVLLAIAQYSGIERQIFTRDGSGDDLHRAKRWELPRPREFDLSRDIGDQSVESMLEAVRHGHIEAVAWLVNQWRECSLAIDFMDRGPRWQPEQAQRILDGLAATEDLRCAEEILRRSTSTDCNPRHPRRRFRDDWFIGDEVNQRMAEDLFAPLFWRLPVEAVLKSMKPSRYPGERLSVSGQRLLAEELMGLKYDPDRSALEEALTMAARSPISEKGRDYGEDERVLMRLHRSHQKQTEQVQLSDDAPPSFVWDEIFREDPFFQGTLEEARDKVAGKVKTVWESNVGLRNRIKSLVGRRELATRGLLGDYEASGYIKLYTPVIAASADVLGLPSRYLKSVVFIHLSAWLLAHEARDLDGQPGYGFAPSAPGSPFANESPSHVALVQAFTDRLIHRLKDPNLQAAFEKLSKSQPKPYARWVSMRNLPLEKLRMLLLMARANASAMGLPGATDGE